MTQQVEGRDQFFKKIASLAAAFSDSTRVAIMDLLFEEGRATTMDIATTLGVLQPRVSSHLAILLKYGLVSVVGSGRQRIYSIGPGATTLLKDLTKLAWERKRSSSISRGAAREVRKDTEIRQCRTCYDHLAGVAGINLLKDMMRRGWLSKKRPHGANVDRPQYELTPTGERALRKRKVDLEGAYDSNRTFAFGCLDWTEREPHLGGSLGCVVLRSILSQGVAERMPGTRALKLARPVSSWIDP